MSRSNLAFALEAAEILEAQDANEGSLERLSGSGTVAVAVETPPRPSLGRQRPFVPLFADDFSSDFRRFRVY